MSTHRTSIDGVGNGSTGKAKMHLALLKLSTANAFAKGMNAFAAARGTDSSPTTVSQDASHGVQGSTGSLFFSDDSPAPAASCSSAFATALTALTTLTTADAPTQLSPTIPRSPYHGMYADYEDVMELLHSGVIADGSARRLMSHVLPDTVVHVAHLGIGACCSVDLVAVHCPDGSRLLAAAKSCYLPPSDPRLRASLREAELLRKCADCPFIVQLLTVMQVQEPPCGAAASPITSSPAGTPLRRSMQLSISHASGELAAAYGGSGMPGGGEGGLMGGGGGGGGAMSPVSSASSAAALAAMMSSPSYQSWMQWRGGGSAEDLERQIMQRLMAATAGAGAGGSAGLDSGGGGYGGFGGGGGAMGGAIWPGSLVSSRRSSLSGWEPSLHEELHDTTGGGGSGGGGGGGGGGGVAQGGGGGWAYGGGPGCGGGAAAAAAQEVSRRPRLRRASMDVVDMYGGCTGMGVGWGGGGGGAAAISGAEAAAGGVEAPVLCTLLLGWARCGDLRRLVQLMLGRSPTHQNNKQTGAAPTVPGLPPLVPEDAARFYTACLALALEHLHAKLHTVHRDLKLANLLLLDSGYVIVGDLGTAVDLTTVPGGRLNSRVGSPGHMAPECRDRDEAGYDTAADMWSVGACLYALLTGHLPAGVSGPPNRHWTPPVSRHWSSEVQGLLGRLLACSPGQRPTVAQLMRDPWFRGFNWKALREQRLQPPGSVPWRELLWWPKEGRQLL